MAKRKRKKTPEEVEFDRRAMANAQLLREYADGKLDREYGVRREKKAS